MYVYMYECVNIGVIIIRMRCTCININSNQHKNYIQHRSVLNINPFIFTIINTKLLDIKPVLIGH